MSSFLHDRNIFKFEGLHLINYREYADVLLPITFNIIFGPTECYVHLNFFFFKQSAEYILQHDEDQKSVF